MSHRIKDIEVLRAIAVTLVAIHHVPMNLVYWSSPAVRRFLASFTGDLGVDLFLVISGFVIARTLIPTLRATDGRRAFFTATVAFWIKRFWRLIPSAWLWLLLAILGAAFLNESGSFRAVHRNMEVAAYAVLNLANLHLELRAEQIPIEEFATRGHILFPFWSLSLEEQFYLTLPFLVFLCRDRLATVLLVLVLAQLLTDKLETRLVAFRTDGLFLGVLLALHHGKTAYKRLEPSWLESGLTRCVFVLGCLGLMAGAGVWFQIPDGYRYAVGAVAGTLLVFAASFDRDYIVRTRWIQAALLWVGSRSYAIYLAHIPAFALTRELYYRMSSGEDMAFESLPIQTLYVAAGFILTGVFADLNFRFVETPLRSRGRKIAEGYRDRRQAQELA